MEIVALRRSEVAQGEFHVRRGPQSFLGMATLEKIKGQERELWRS